MTRTKAKRTVHEETETERTLFIEFRRTHDLLMGEMAALFKRHGISEPQFNVLRILRGAGPAGLSCQEIGARMITRVPDVTRILDRLEAGGFIRRARGTEDRRVVTTVLTDAGREVLARLDDPVDLAHRGQFASLSRKEQQTLLDLLRRLRGEGDGATPRRSS